MLNDLKFVTLAKDGNQEGVAALYEMYFDSIYRFFYWQTNQDAAAAEDLTQDTFIEMAKAIRKFRGASSFRNWLYTIAKYQLLRWIKINKYNLPQESLFDNLSLPDQSIDPQEQQQAVNQVQQLLAKLAEKERKIITLRYLKHYSVAEVARELDISISNIKVIAHRAIKKMKNIGL